MQARATAVRCPAFWKKKPKWFLSLSVLVGGGQGPHEVCDIPETPR